jgi:hypothetical protein
MTAGAMPTVARIAAMPLMPVLLTTSFLTEAVNLLLSITKWTTENDKVRIINAANRVVHGIRKRHAAAKREPAADLWGGPLVLAPLPDRARDPAREPKRKQEPEQPALDPRIANARIGDKLEIGGVEVEVVDDPPDDDEAAP